jgi:hypothetical protein
VTGVRLDAAILVIALAGARAGAEPLPRARHVGEALAAVRALGPERRDQLDRALYGAARTQCHADAGTPTVSCLVTAAQAVCASDADRARCEAAADVIVANLRSVASFVSDAARLQLARGATEYRTALAGELGRRYALLAAELVLDGAGAAPDGAAIDTLCQQRDRRLHACEPGDAACVPSLPWSRCVAALVWFIGASP